MVVFILGTGNAPEDPDVKGRMLTDESSYQLANADTFLYVRLLELIARGQAGQMSRLSAVAFCRNITAGVTVDRLRPGNTSMRPVLCQLQP